MDVSVLIQHLFQVESLIIMVSCGILMEIFKRGPLTKNFATSKWGKVGSYYAPYLWGVVLTALPIGLGPAALGIASKILMGLILGASTSQVYSLVRGTMKNIKKIPE